MISIHAILSRWSRRTLAANRPKLLNPVGSPVDLGLPTDDTTTARDAARQAVWQNLFRQAEFSVRDGMNEYDENYTFFQPRGELLTQDMLRAVMREQASEVNTSDTELAQHEIDDSGDPSATPDSA